MGLIADLAKDDRVPNFAEKVTAIADGAFGKGLHAEDTGLASWNAPCNFQALRGSLAFFYRFGYPVGVAPFVIFRVGLADLSIWDMAFLRMDWNGHGFDAFVTDNGLARTRISLTVDKLAVSDVWTQLAFSGDETLGVQLFVDGKLANKTETKADYDAGLDQFGIAGRVIAPHQEQRRYNFTRGVDLDEVKVCDRALDAAAVARLAKNELAQTEASIITLDHPAARVTWRPPYLSAPAPIIR